MKKFLYAALAGLVVLAGCGKSAYIDQQLSAYNNAMAVYQQATAAKASQPPMVSVSFHPDGRLASMQVAQRMEYPDIPAFRPASHPGWALSAAGIRAAGVVGGIFAGGWAVSELAATMAESAGTHIGGDVVSSFNPNNAGVIGSQGNFAPNGQFAGGDGIFNPSDVSGEGALGGDQSRQPYNNQAEIYPPPEIEPPEIEPPEIEPPEAESLGVQYGVIKWSD